MTAPYRSAPPQPLPCPRCKKKQLPPLDVATCACGGAWVTAFAASEVLRAEELRVDPVTRWWRVREPCPVCGEQMLLRGDEPGLFQGCDLHGYWIDADTIAHTGLARGIDHEALDRKRQDHARVEQEEAARAALAHQREQEKRAREQREYELRQQALADMPIEEKPVGRVTRSEVFSLRAALASSLGVPTALALLERIGSLERRVTELEAALAASSSTARPDGEP